MVLFDAPHCIQPGAALKGGGGGSWEGGTPVGKIGYNPSRKIVFVAMHQNMNLIGKKLSEIE